MEVIHETSCASSKGEIVTTWRKPRAWVPKDKNATIQAPYVGSRRDFFWVKLWMWFKKHVICFRWSTNFKRRFVLDPTSEHFKKSNLEFNHSTYQTLNLIMPLCEQRLRWVCYIVKKRACLLKFFFSFQVVALRIKIIQNKL